jgi:hypothetical protein
MEEPLAECPAELAERERMCGFYEAAGRSAMRTAEKTVGGDG